MDNGTYGCFKFRYCYYSKLRGDTYPCYNEILIEDNKVEVYLISTGNGKKEHLAKYSVEIEG